MSDSRELLICSAVERAGLNGLNEGQRVAFELQTERGRTAAVDLKPL